MKNFKFRYLLVLIFLLPASVSLAMTIKSFNLNQMTDSADKIFRGKVIAVESGTISIGGGKLSTVTYTLEVKDLIKGELAPQSGKASNLLKIKMVGSLKEAAVKDGVRFVGGFRAPTLVQNSEYLLFTTAPSAIGLSMTVGVGQGVFSFKDGGSVSNEFDNAGA